MALPTLSPSGIRLAPVCQKAGSSDAATQNENWKRHKKAGQRPELFRTTPLVPRLVWTRLTRHRARAGLTQVP